MESAQPLQVGTQLEGFEITRITNTDPARFVYDGIDLASKKAVVINEYPLGAKQDLVALAKARHPNLAGVLREFEADGNAYLVTEPAGGEALSEILRREATFDEARLKSVLLPLADGLEAAHAAGVLHLDIHPERIVVKGNGSPILVGFGGGAQARTPGYSAIEQYSSDFRHGRWTDIYALGALGYRLISGREPVDALTRHAQDIMKPAREIGADRYHRSLLQSIDWALKVHPLERPQNLGQWKDALLGLRDTVVVGASSAATVPITATMIRKFSELREKKHTQPPVPPAVPAKPVVAPPQRGGANATPIPPHRDVQVPPHGDSLRSRATSQDAQERPPPEPAEPPKAAAPPPPTPVAPAPPPKTVPLVIPPRAVAPKPVAAKPLATPIPPTIAPPRSAAPAVPPLVAPARKAAKASVPPPAQPSSMLSGMGALVVLLLAIGYWWYTDVRRADRVAVVATPSPAPVKLAPEAQPQTPAPSPPPPVVDQQPAPTPAAATAEMAEPKVETPEPMGEAPKPIEAPKPVEAPKRAPEATAAEIKPRRIGAPEAPAGAAAQKRLVSELRTRLGGTWTQESTYVVMVPGSDCYAKVARSWTIRISGATDEGRALAGSFTTGVRATSAERAECRQFDDQITVQGTLNARPLSATMLQVEAIPSACSGDCDPIAEVFDYRTLERRYRFSISSEADRMGFSEGEVDFEVSKPR